MNGPSSILRSSRREAWFVVVVWIASCAYTVGYAALFAYRPGPAPHLVWGIPSWVLWGVFAPWMVCLAITSWFALWRMQDEDLEVVPDE